MYHAVVCCSTGPAAAFIRGLFELIYSAATLTLLPHQPCGLLSLEQRAPIRWGAYKFTLSTSGNRCSGIANVSLSSSPTQPFSHSADAIAFNSSSVVLSYSKLPAPSPLAVEGVTSPFLAGTADVLHLHVTFASTATKDSPERACRSAARVETQHEAVGLAALGKVQDHTACALPANVSQQVAVLTNFSAAVRAHGQIDMYTSRQVQLRGVPLTTTRAYEQAMMALAFARAGQERCILTRNGTWAPLPSERSEEAAQLQFWLTVDQLFVGLSGLMGWYAQLPGAIPKTLASLWAAAA